MQSSAGGVDRSPELPGFAGKAHVEEHLRGSGLSWTVVAPAWFMSNWDWPFFRPAILDGTLALPLSPDTVLHHVAPSDIGRVAAEALVDPDAWKGRRVELAGDDRPIGDVANALGRSLGRPVAYRQITPGEFEAGHGAFFAGLFRWYAEEGYRADVPGLRRELPGLLDLDDYLAVRGSFAADPVAA